MIYMDNAATTYPKPQAVLKALDEANRNAFNTGRGSYKPARNLTSMIDSTREKIKKINNVVDGETVFTSSATQALNDIIFGIDIENGDNIYISPFEHNSIVRPLYQLKKNKNINIHIIPFKKDTWNLDEDKLKNMFVLNTPKAILLTHVNNVTGYIMPYEKIFEMSSKYNSINILDCSQSYGIIKLGYISDINYIVFAGHKSLYASFGIAGFIKLKNDILKKRIFGGTGSDTMNYEMPDSFPSGYEAGSPNIVAICGLNASCNWIQQQKIYEHEMELTQYLIKELLKVKKCKLYIPDDHSKIFGIVSFNIDGYSASEVGTILDDEFDIYVRTGYHCCPLIHEFIDSISSEGTVRISLSHFSIKSDIEELIKALKTM